MVKFEPKTEAEILEKQVFKSGIYSYTITDATEATSQNGNSMIRLEIEISLNGQVKRLQDYLVPVGRGLAKVRQICQVCGLLDRFQSGILSSNDFVSHSGRLRLGIENDRSKKYPPRNIVTDYLS